MEIPLRVNILRKYNVDSFFILPMMAACTIDKC